MNRDELVQYMIETIAVIEKKYLVCDSAQSNKMKIITEILSELNKVVKNED